VKNSRAAIQICGGIRDPHDLNYLRDTIGVLAALMDSKGVAVLNQYSARWYKPAQWQHEVWRPTEHDPSNMINTIVTAEGSQNTWRVATRGMRIYGRPDVACLHTARTNIETALDLCHRIANVMAQGSIIPDGKVIRSTDIKGQLVCKFTPKPSGDPLANSTIEFEYPG